MRTGPYGNRGDEVMATWRNGIDAVAECPNIIIKMGGVGMPRIGFDWHTRVKPVGSQELAESIAPYIFTPSRSSVPTGACSRATFRWTRFHFPTT